MSLAARLGELRDTLHLRQLTARLESDYGAPLIVIGMHRSGTSLTVQLLQRCGGYFGNQLVQSASEALEFLRLNTVILHLQRSSWFSLARDFDLRDERRKAAAARYVVRSRHQLWSGFFERFGDPAKNCPEDPLPPAPEKPRRNSFLLSWPSRTGGAAFWGWKDPRTTLTLPVWLRLFPRAKVLHVIRDGAASALSLALRTRKTGIGAPRCEDLTHCFGLWERYVSEGLAWRAGLGDRYMEIRYEDLLADPVTTFSSLMDFIGVGTTLPPEAFDGIDVERGRARWTSYPELVRCTSRSAIYEELYGTPGASEAHAPDERSATGTTS